MPVGDHRGIDAHARALVGRATSHGSGRRSQWSASSTWYPSAIALAKHAVLVAQSVTDGGNGSVASESTKHAARRPSPPLPRPASGSISDSDGRSMPSRASACCASGSTQRLTMLLVSDAADEKLHRQVIDPLGIGALVGVLGLQPALRQQIPHRTRHRLEALAPGCLLGVDDVVIEEMAFVRRVGVAGELHGPDIVVLGNGCHDHALSLAYTPPVERRHTFA